MSEIAVKAQDKPKVFFPNLNGVRAIAALLVIIGHIELAKPLFHFAIIPYFEVQYFGRVGVSIFFSLSGFLITYLLLEEKRKFKAVNFPGFYMRRILRIWPLYFLIVIIGFFIYPRGGSPQAFWLSVFFLPNLAFALKLLPAMYDPIWSIGTEEQFYIFHPHFFRFKNIKDIFYALGTFLVVFLIVVQIIRHYTSNDPITNALAEVSYYARFDNMTIGALVAVLYYNKKHELNLFRFQGLFDIVFKKSIQVLLLVLFCITLLLYINYNFPEGDLVLAGLSALLIVNLCETQTSVFNLDYKPLHFVGEVSYGMYLWHKFVVYFTLWLVSTRMTWLNTYLKSAVIYTIVLVLTIAVASASYYGYERYFLKLKKRFSRVTQH